MARLLSLDPVCRSVANWFILVMLAIELQLLSGRGWGGGGKHGRGEILC